MFLMTNFKISAETIIVFKLHDLSFFFSIVESCDHISNIWYIAHLCDLRYASFNLTTLRCIADPALDSSDLMSISNAPYAPRHTHKHKELMDSTLVAQNGGGGAGIQKQGTTTYLGKEGGFASQSSEYRLHDLNSISETPLNCHGHYCHYCCFHCYCCHHCQW